MKCMVLVKASRESEAGEMPELEMMEAMGRYNMELVDAGVMKAGEGLHPTSRAVRVVREGGSTEIVRGPFASNLDDTVAGFWMWEVKDMDDALAWAGKMPPTMKGRSVVELRPVFEPADFGEAMTPEVRELEDAVEQRLKSREERL